MFKCCGCNNKKSKKDEANNKLANSERKKSVDSNKIEKSEPEEELKNGAPLSVTRNEDSSGNNVDESRDNLSNEINNLPSAPQEIIRSPQKNLYGAAAYIERTIDDGPEEEGDDSVFEAGPPSIDNNLNKKTLPGTDKELRTEIWIRIS